MKKVYDLSILDWKLSGWTPHLWELEKTMEIGASPNAEIPSLPAMVPGSVQLALKNSGYLPDWNVGLNYRECEWVENRHWIYETTIPAGWIKPGLKYRLNCQGLDYSGWIVLNNVVVGSFKGTHKPHLFAIEDKLKHGENSLMIIFDLPPRWLGQFGRTSQMKEWKTRFNYTWDWVIRLVQIGIWDQIYLEETDGREINEFRCYADADVKSSTGILTIKGKVSGSPGFFVKAELLDGKKIIKSTRIAIDEFNAKGFEWNNLPVDLWWPNMEGSQPLYDIRLVLEDEQGRSEDAITKRTGFKNVVWEHCEGAPKEAYPWICVVNGRKVFLQGVNWVPPLPNYADVGIDRYKKLINLYKDLGLNILRVWGGGVLEREDFYNLCDESGLMVWQEFPMSSSGIENLPPDDPNSLEEMAKIAESYIARRQHHASLVIWCGGNELHGNNEGELANAGKPVDGSHPMIAMLADIVKRMDPKRRFIFTSPSGPVFYAHEDNFGKGLHWHVHGPWKATGSLEDWKRYWENDDAFCRSESGAPGASSADLIRKYAGNLEVMPASAENPLWRRCSTWWIEWDVFKTERGREPSSLEEYVEWSQQRQSEALSIVVMSCKQRFPKCGAVLLWMGHDCFPCTANTSIIDFEGNPKPTALELKKIWRQRF